MENEIIQNNARLNVSFRSETNPNDPKQQSKFIRSVDCFSDCGQHAETHVK